MAHLVRVRVRGRGRGRIRAATRDWRTWLGIGLGLGLGVALKERHEAGALCWREDPGEYEGPWHARHRMPRHLVRG